jgi:hypothetical protein
MKTVLAIMMFGLFPINLHAEGEYDTKSMTAKKNLLFSDAIGRELAESGASLFALQTNSKTGNSTLHVKIPGNSIVQLKKDDEIKFKYGSDVWSLRFVGTKDGKVMIEVRRVVESQ